MESMNDFDKIIKDKIGSIEEMPPAHLWANISKEIAVPQAAAIPFYKPSKFIISAAVASIVVVMGAMWFFASNKTTDDKMQLTIDTEYNIDEEAIAEEQIIKKNTEEPQSVEAIEQQQIVNNKKTTNNTIIEKSAIDIAPLDDQPTNDNQQYKRKKLSYTTTEIANNSQEQLPQTNSNSKQETVLITDLSPFMEKDVVANNEVDNTSEKGAVSKIEEENNVDVANAEKVEKVSSIAVVEEQANSTAESNVENKELVETTIEENEAKATDSKVIVSDNKESNPDDEMPKSQFSPRTNNYDRMAIGVHFGLENIKIEDINIATYNGDISFNYQNMNFIAQTGIGLQMSKDKNDYHQQISTNEFQATQIRFDSIVFVPDGNGGVIPTPVDPTYEDVYDTVNHVYESDVTETYYISFLPLLSFPWLPDFLPPNLQVHLPLYIYPLLSTDYQLAERRSNQLQYVLSAGVSYAISKKMSFNAELMGKYYQYAMYTNTNYESNPWSYEARLGITYLLN